MCSSTYDYDNEEGATPDRDVARKSLLTSSSVCYYNCFLFFPGLVEGTNFFLEKRVDGLFNVFNVLLRRQRDRLTVHYGKNHAILLLHEVPWWCKQTGDNHHRRLPHNFLSMILP